MLELSRFKIKIFEIFCIMEAINTSTSLHFASSRNNQVCNKVSSNNKFFSKL